MNNKIAYIGLEFDYMIIHYNEFGKYKEINNPTKEDLKIIEENNLTFLFTEKDNRDRKHYFNEYFLDKDIYFFINKRFHKELDIFKKTKKLRNNLKNI